MLVLIERLLVAAQPPTNIARPSTSSRLPRMLPVSDALTTSVSPRWSASRAMINSAALPNVALRKPPSPGADILGRLVGGAPISPASGTIASAEVTNTSTSLAPSTRRRRSDQRSAERRSGTIELVPKHKRANRALLRAGCPCSMRAIVNPTASRRGVTTASREGGGVGQHHRPQRSWPRLSLSARPDFRPITSHRAERGRVGRCASDIRQGPFRAPPPAPTSSSLRLRGNLHMNRTRRSPMSARLAVALAVVAAYLHSCSALPA